jgi:predicted ArsR family transcriptional regulator
MSTQRLPDDIAALSLLDEPVRRALYEWVVAQARDVGREEAAKALGITRSLATFHLDRLTEGGLLEGGYRRLTGRVGPGAGRPARVYRRAKRDFAVTIPDRRYQRTADLFASALEALGDGSPPPALTAAAAKLGTELGRANVDRRRASARSLTAALERGGYEPVAEAGRTIRLRNCPFDALVEEHRRLVCGTNLALAQGIASGAGVTDLVPILDPQPGYCCVAFVPQPAIADRSRGHAQG